jgi:hypothetical protein
LLQNTGGIFYTRSEVFGSMLFNLLISQIHSGRHEFCYSVAKRGLKMRISKIVALGALATLGLGLASVEKAEAAYTAYLYQDGGNVVGTGNGSLDTTDLSNLGLEGASNSVNASLGYFHLDDQTDGANVFGAVTGPVSFGAGSSFVASTADNGNAVAIQG